MFLDFFLIYYYFYSVTDEIHQIARPIIHFRRLSSLPKTFYVYFFIFWTPVISFCLLLVFIDFLRLINEIKLKNLRTTILGWY